MAYARIGRYKFFFGVSRDGLTGRNILETDRPAAPDRPALRRRLITGSTRVLKKRREDDRPMSCKRDSPTTPIDAQRRYTEHGPERRTQHPPEKECCPLENSGLGPGRPQKGREYLFKTESDLEMSAAPPSESH